MSALAVAEPAPAEEGVSAHGALAFAQRCPALRSLRAICAPGTTLAARQRCHAAMRACCPLLTDLMLDSVMDGART